MYTDTHMHVVTNIKKGILKKLGTGIWECLREFREGENVIIIFSKTKI